tara:strand:+ start:742 stop:1707 length:966 start_codon:yes stop_codon:yes gene_type:complete
MATEASINLAQLISNQLKKFYESQRKFQDQLQNRRNKMGIGRFVGGLLSLAVPGVGALAGAAITGIGSRLGQEIAQRTTKVDDIAEQSLFKNKIADFRSKGTEALRDLNRSANVGALTDAFSSFVIRGGKDLVGDVRDAAARNLGIGADEFGRRVTEEGLAQNPGLRTAEEIINPSEKSLLDFLPANDSPNKLPEAIKSMNTPGADVTTKRVFNQNDINITGNLNTDMSPPPFELPTGSMNPATQSTTAAAIDNTMNVGPGFTSNRTGPFSQFTGTANQNRMLADAMGLNPNRSIVDQINRFGGDSSFLARQQLYNDYFGY